MFRKISREKKRKKGMFGYLELFYIISCRYKKFFNSLSQHAKLFFGMLTPTIKPDINYKN